MDGGRTQENGRVRKEDAGAFERRTVGTDAQGHRQYGLLEHHGDSAVAYTPVEFSSADSEAGRAASAFTKNGIRAVVTDGAFETNSNGRTVRHLDAATAPDGTVYISSETVIPAEQIVSHESVHVLQKQGNPLYVDYYEALYAQANMQSEAYKKAAQKINEAHYNNRLDLNDIDSVAPVFTELSAYIHQFIQTDPVWASERFSGAFSDWDGVVEASRRLAQGLENQGAAGDAQGYGVSGRTAYPAGLREYAGRGNIEGEGGARENEIQDIRRGTGSLYGESRGSGGTEADGRGQAEVRRTREETRETFTRRAEESAQAQAGGDRRLSHLEEHGNSLIAYREKTADETTAPGRAVLWLRKNGIDAVLTDGMFESNRKGRTTRHPEAATSPDGKVFISSEATLSEAELSRHEAVHVLEAKNSPLFYDFYEDLQIWMI